MDFVTIAIAAIIIFILFINNKTELKKFIVSEDSTVNLLREKDYNFYVLAKYGDKVDANVLYSARVRLAGYAMLFSIILFVMDFNVWAILKIGAITFAVYKMPYFSLKSYYKKYMNQIDQMLPYYLKSLEILCQNYTVPVALSRSIEEAPEIFKPGLRSMIAKIDAGDSSIQPYMDFAIEYPVKDSMRMMRLLYRLSLGAQENKHQQLLLFSKSVSSLQNKAREMKYKARLDWMEKRTMIMLVVTGGGLLVILLFSMLFLLNI